MQASGREVGWDAHGSLGQETFSWICWSPGMSLAFAAVYRPTVGKL